MAMRNLLPILLVVLTTVFALMSTAITCTACGVAQELGGPQVNIADELAVIIWDKETKTEHFIRQAVFKSENGAVIKNLGFIVPTPSVPTLQEADPAIFELARTVARERVYPPIEYDTPFKYAVALFFVVTVVLLLVFATAYTFRTRDKASGFAVAFASILVVFFILQYLDTRSVNVFSTVSYNLGSPDLGDVDVLKRQRVAGMDAAILQATDPHALSEWLRVNGFATPPGFHAWLVPYVSNRWIITAFKVAPDSSDEQSPTSKGSLSGKAVRMSFTADAPFFPYSEPHSPTASGTPPASAGSRPQDPLPGSATTPARMLRVAVIANDRVQGSSLIDLKSGVPIAWPGQLRYSDTSTPGEDPLEVPPGDAVNAKSWLSLARLMDDPIASRFPSRLTCFEDTSLRQTYGDLTFTPAPDQAAFRRSRTSPDLIVRRIYIGNDPIQNTLAGLTVLATIFAAWYICRATYLVCTAARPANP